MYKASNETLQATLEPPPRNRFPTPHPAGAPVDRAARNPAPKSPYRLAKGLALVGGLALAGGALKKYVLDKDKESDVKESEQKYPLAAMFTNLGNQTQPDPVARARDLLEKVEKKKPEHGQQKKAEEDCSSDDADSKRLCEYMDRTFQDRVGTLNQLFPQAAAARAEQGRQLSGKIPSGRVVTRDVTLSAQLRAKMG